MALITDYKYKDEYYQSNTFSILPAGNYRVRIEDVQEKTSRSHKDMLEITLAVSGHNSKLWYYLVIDDSTHEADKMTSIKLGTLFDSFGITKGDMCISNWKGHVGGAKVRHVKDNDGNDRADVHYFLKPEQVKKLPAWQEPTASSMAADPNGQQDILDFNDPQVEVVTVPF